MHAFHFRLVIVVFAVGLLPRGLMAGAVVDFETLPDGSVPVDNDPLPIDSPYTLDNGTTLRFLFRADDASGGAIDVFDQPGRLERYGGGQGDSDQGFVSSNGTRRYDSTPNPTLDELLGQFFLRSPVDVSEAGAVAMKIQYGNTMDMHYAAGEIWDIDANGVRREQWNVAAYAAGADLDDDPIAIATSDFGHRPSVSGSLDSRPWRFELIADQVIDFVIVAYIGDIVVNDQGEDGGVGLAFNNFTTARTLPADFDEDFDVDDQDLVKWRVGAGLIGEAERMDGDADLDANVTGDDFLIWQQQVGRQIGVSVHAVPEPAAIALAAAGLGWAVAATRRRRQSR